MEGAIQEGKPQLTRNATTARVCSTEYDRDILAEKGASSYQLEPLELARCEKVTGRVAITAFQYRHCIWHLDSKPICKASALWNSP